MPERATDGNRIDDRVVPPAPDVVVDGVEKALGTYVVLDRVSLTVRAGTTTAVVAPIGRGANSLLQAALGLVPVDAGDIRIGELSVVEAGPARMSRFRRECGVVLAGGVPHGTVVDADCTVEASLRSAREAAGRAPDAARVAECLTEFGLAGVADSVLSGLPTGAARRAAVARAFVADPPLILLEAPSAGVDGEERREVVDALCRARASSRATLIVGTTDLELAAALADQVVVIGRGLVLGAGAPADVLSAGETVGDLGVRLGGVTRDGDHEADLARRRDRRIRESRESLDQIGLLRRALRRKEWTIVVLFGVAAALFFLLADSGWLGP